VHDKTRSRYVVSKDAHLVAFASIVSCEFSNKPIVCTGAEWLGFLSLISGVGIYDGTGA